MRPTVLRASLGAVALLVGQGVLTGATVTADSAVTITADMPAAVPAGHNWGFNDFFPRTLTVRQGTTVDFNLEGFHTATLLAAGTTPAQDLQANGIAATDGDDTVPNPNGTTHTQIRIPALMPTSFACGSPAAPCSFDGSATVSSGAPTGAPFAVTVNAAPGTYTFLCRIHPGMRGWIRVVGPDHPVPPPAQVAARVRAQVAADVAAGSGAEAKASHQAPHRNPDGTTTWTLSAGSSSPDGHTVILEMLPRNVHIRPGDTVRWVSPTPNEPHTVTFPSDLGTDQVPLCEAGTVDVPEPCGPPDEIEFAPGNGVSNVTSPSTESDSGLLSSTAEAAAFGLPQSATLKSWTVSFAGAQAGTYHYVCQIHEGMEGTVTVVPGG